MSESSDCGGLGIVKLVHHVLLLHRTRVHLLHLFLHPLLRRRLEDAPLEELALLLLNQLRRAQDRLLDPSVSLLSRGNHTIGVFVAVKVIEQFLICVLVNFTLLAPGEPVQNAQILLPLALKRTASSQTRISFLGGRFNLGYGAVVYF